MKTHFKNRKRMRKKCTLFLCSNHFIEAGSGNIVISHSPTRPLAHSLTATRMVLLIHQRLNTIVTIDIKY